VLEGEEEETKNPKVWGGGQHFFLESRSSPFVREIDISISANLLVTRGFKVLNG